LGVCFFDLKSDIYYAQLPMEAGTKDCCRLQRPASPIVATGQLCTYLIYYPQKICQGAVLVQHILDR